MASLGRRIAGKTAQSVGKAFQDRLETYCKWKKIDLIRLPDGARTVGPAKIIRIKSPFDYIVGLERNLIFLDLKSFDKDTLTFSDLKEHQVDALRVIFEHGSDTVHAGYLVEFRPVGLISYFNAKVLRGMHPRESFRSTDGIVCGESRGNMFELDFGKVFGTKE